jgi:hypothetical protein
VSSNVTITAADGSLRGKATASVFNAPPTVATKASATLDPATGTTAALSVLGKDDGGPANLSYTWTTTVLPKGARAPTFSPNASNAADNTTVTFAALGSYSFSVKITDSRGLSVTSGVAVTVAQELTRITVSPATAAVMSLGTKKFTAVGYDQFGGAMASQPVFTWIATAGTIDPGSGLFTAPTSLGPVTITAASGSVQGTAQVTVANMPNLNLQDAGLETLTDNLFAQDGQINRDDMIQILKYVATENGGVLSSADFSDLQTIVGDATMLNMPNYVQVLAGDVVKGNTANAKYQGQSLGNLAAGSTATHLTELVDKWFLGMDHPAVTMDFSGSSYTYETCAGSLFGPSGPQYADVQQGNLGDCYFVSALGSIAKSNPAAIENMFVYNGDNTWTVRFYDNGTPNYVTVDRMLPADSNGLGYSDFLNPVSSSNNVLWIALAEKAYAQWNETGNDGRGDTSNSYASIESGWMADVDTQVLGSAATTYYNYDTSVEQTLINAIGSNQAVSCCTIDSADFGATKLISDHAYNVVGYNGASGTFTLYNPWGPKYNYSWAPGTALECFLTWDQATTYLQGFVVADTSPTPPPISSPAMGTGASLSSLQFAPTWSGLGIASPNPGTFSDPVAPNRGPAGADSDAAPAWFASLGSDGPLSGSARAHVSRRPSSELTPDLVDAVFHPAANHHKKLPDVGDGFPDAAE